ncbi:hypothetical protein LSPCS325_48770 [Lysinibacillus sp. CTST325]
MNNIRRCLFYDIKRHHHNVGLISVSAGRFLGASDEPLLLLLSLRFRTENIRCAPGSRANTKALSQDVMVLAFVPLSLIPKESPSLHSNQLIYMAYVLTNIIPDFL